LDRLYCQGFFNTLFDSQQYAATHIENLISNGKSNLDSDCIAWYHQQKITYFEQFKYSFGLSSPLISLYDSVMKQLQMMANERELSGLTGDYSMVITDDHPQYIIFGDIQGAFHSLVRCLTYLYNNHLIDNQFKLVSPHTYIIFNGNVVSFLFNKLTFTYGVETLALVLTCIMRNPDHVMYVRGSSVLYDVLGLLEMISIVKYNFPTFPFFFKEIFKRFLLTLPQAVYSFSSSDSRQEALCISGENKLPIIPIDSIAKKKKKISKAYCYVRCEPITIHNVNAMESLVKVHIGSMDRNFECFDNRGLKFLYNQKNRGLWNVFSSPLPFYQQMLGFDRDAFVIAEQKHPIARTQLHVLTRPLTRQGLLFDQEIFDGGLGIVISDANKQMVQSAESIKLASAIYLTKAPSNIGQRLCAGLRLAELDINTSGGIHNKPLRINIVDTKYEASTARAVVEQLYYKKHIDMLVGAVGISSIQAYKYLVDEDKISLFFPSASGDYFHESEKSIIHINPSYDQEITALIHYAINKIHVQHIVFFYRDDKLGVDMMKVARRILKYYGIKDWFELPYKNNEVDFDQQITKIANELIDSIVFIGFPSEIIGFMKQLEGKRIENISTFSLSFSFDEVLELYFKRRGIPITFSQTVPEVSNSSSIPIVREFCQVCHRLRQESDVHSFKSFLEVKVLADACAHMEEPLTRQKLMEKLEAYRHYDYKGIDLDFNPKTRSLSEKLWLRLFDGTTIEYPIPTI
jgi:ABC-type branched-subunit amino acid transport system substrate-binding protein